MQIECKLRRLCGVWHEERLPQCCLEGVEKRCVGWGLLQPEPTSCCQKEKKGQGLMELQALSLQRKFVYVTARRPKYFSCVWRTKFCLKIITLSDGTTGQPRPCQMAPLASLDLARWHHWPA
eukprot:365095-Chlamydomonas_euryale.AAC.10